MSVRYSKWNSTIATQPVVPDIAVPTIGSLPTRQRSTTIPAPEVIAQGNSFFSLDSIGSARFETRNFDITSVGPTISLQTCSAEIPVQAGLSPRRPALIGIVDPFGSSISQRAASVNPEASTDASLDFVEFEARLAVDDYQYLADTVKNSDSTSAIYSLLENQVAADIASVQSPASDLARLATTAEKFAQDLDIKFSWDSLREDIVANYDNYFSEGDFKPASAYTSLLDLYGSENSSSTTILQGIYRELQSPADTQLESILESQGILFDDGNIEGYSEKSRMEKVSLCCKLLTGIFNNNVVGNLPSPVLPVTYSGGFVFESRKPGDRSLSNYESIVAPVLNSLSTRSVEAFNTSFVSNFASTIAFAERRNSVKPVDIFRSMMYAFVESFPTLQVGGDLNGDEITDAVSLLLSLKTPFSNAEFNGVIRGSLLTMLLDRDVDTLRFGSALNATLVGDPSIYQTRSFRIFPDGFLNTERLKNFPRSSHQYANSIVAGDLPSQLDPVIGSGIQQGSGKGNWRTNAPKNFDSNIERLADRRIARGLPQGYDIASYKIAGTGSVISQLVTNSIDKFSRGTKTTIAKSAELAYGRLAGIVRNSGISLSSLRLTSGSALNQRMIYSIILECIANITAIFLRPGYSSGIEEVSRSNQVITDLEKKLQELQNELNDKRLRLEMNLERLDVIADNVERGEADEVEEDREIRRENRSLRNKISELESEIAAINSQIVQSSTIKKFYLVVNPSFRSALQFVNDVANSTSSTSLALTFENYSSRNLAENAYRAPADISAGISSIASTGRKTMSRLASLKAVSQKLSNSTAELVTSFSLAESSTRFLGSKREQIFSSLTSETASQTLLALNGETQKGALSLHSRQAVYDVISTRKLKNLLTNQASSRNSAIAIVGIPPGFMQALRTQPNGTANSARPSYYSIALTGRSLTYPYLNGVEGPKFNFHPFVSCRFVDDQVPTIDGPGTIYSCFSIVSSKWLDVGYAECVSFIKRGGAFEGEPSTASVSEDDAKAIVQEHFYDAICKSCIRTTMGIDFGNINTRPSMSQDRANLAISMMANSPANLFPRRGLQAADFLSLQNDGSILPVVFSGLSGTSSDRTTPADHSVLLDFLSSGIFTSSTLQDRILTVGNFERIHCVIFDPDSFTYRNDDDEVIDSAAHEEFTREISTSADVLISNCSILGIRIGAHYNV